MGLRLTDGDEKPARGEAVTNIGRPEGGFFRGAVSTDLFKQTRQAGNFASWVSAISKCLTRATSSMS